MDIKKLTLKQARQLSDLTQEKACKLIGVTQNTLSLWENGKTTPNAKYIQKITEVYKIPFDMIMFL